MRISTDSMFNQVNEGLQQALRRLAAVQEQASSGKQINRLSDDPAGAVRILDLGGLEARIDRYKKNIDQALPFLEQTDTALAVVEELIGRAKELAIAMTNDTNTSIDRQNAAVEVGQLFSQLLSLANTKVGNQYLFAGFKNGSAPFAQEMGGVTYGGDNGQVFVQANSTTSIPINLVGSEVFQGLGAAGGVDLFDAFSKLEAALKANDTAGAEGVQTQIGRLDSALEQILAGRAQVGARVSLANNASQGLETLKLQTSTIRSHIEDADTVKVFSDLARLQQAYQAALQSAATTIQPTLLDFLK